MKNNNNNKITLMIIGLMVLLVILITSTYAYFSAKSIAKEQETKTAKVDIEVKVDPESSNVTNIKPTIWNEDLEINDDNKNISKIPIKVISHSTIDVNYDLRFDTKNLNIDYTKNLNGGKLSDIKYILIDSDNKKINEGNLDSPTQTKEIISQKLISVDEVQTFTLYIYINDIGKPQNLLQNLNFNIIIKGNATTSHKEPNSPEITDGLIPVVYDEEIESWVTVESNSNDWYNYEIQKWANVVTVTNDSRDSYLSSPSGTPIKEEDINSMWVWVPRYKYRIPYYVGGKPAGNSGYYAIASPPMIDVIFEEGVESTGVTEEEYRNGIGSDGTNDNYYTHPAFTFGSRELTGIWVGKFETSTDDETCNTTSNNSNCLDVNPVIKPNTFSLRYQNVNSQFITALKFSNGEFNNDTGEVTYKINENNKYGLNTNNSIVNTHMAKSTEWGMAAILSQSKYGKMGNDYYENSSKEVFKNNSHDSNGGSYTGRSAGSVNKTETKYGDYAYNDYQCSSTNGTCVDYKYTGLGRGASTTGTIYGIYDMSGGSWEYVMAHCENRIGSSNFTNLPSKEYLNEYTNCPNTTSTKDMMAKKELTILGEGAWETLLWYGDYPYLPTDSDTYSWALRGGRYEYTNNSSGVFAITSTGAGASKVNYSFRTIMIF